MADIDDTDAGGLKAVDIFEEAFDLRVGQSGGWFVEDEDTAMMGERGCDFDELLMADAQCAGGGGRIEVSQADSGEGVAGLLMELIETDETFAAREAVQENVFGNAQGGNDVEFLQDENDAGAFGVAFGSWSVG
jgi:hypothetical protein